MMVKFPASQFEKIYKTLKDCGLFDERYFFKNNLDVKRIRLDPLIDYIFIGYNDGKFPSDKFERIYNILKILICLMNLLSKK